VGGGPDWSRAELGAVVANRIEPFAGHWDRSRCIPREHVHELAEQGFLGALVPTAFGGTGADMHAYMRLNEEIGRACSSMRSAITVHSMVAHALQKWGGERLKARWLSVLGKGRQLAAFALSEPGVGSDASAVQTTAVADGDQYVLNGRKTWITFGQYADIFLVFARSEQGIVALVIERQTPGLAVTPVDHVVGTRASMLADLRFTNCRVPVGARLGTPGFGMSVALSALEIGRFSVACGCVGIIQACLDASTRYAREHQQFGEPLGHHQLVREMIANMAVDLRASRALCERAATAYQNKDASAGHDIFVAKYFASRAATRAALDAVQIHGANGLSERFPTERYLRDAKVMEVIEGSTQIMQLLIAERELESPVPPFR
jgi:hypothetical protein